MYHRFYASDTLQKDVTACVTITKISGVLSNYGGRLGESEGINSTFVNF